VKGRAIEKMTNQVKHYKTDSVDLRYLSETNDLEEAKKLLYEYADSLKVDLSFQDFEKEVSTLPGKYAQPDGVFILAYVDGKIAGCAAIRKIDKELCEMKRLYVRDEYKGLGIGKKLVLEIIGEASKMGYDFIRLDTLPTMKTAQKLYESVGFHDIDEYVYNPIEGTRFMELDLRHSSDKPER